MDDKYDDGSDEKDENDDPAADNDDMSDNDDDGDDDGDMDDDDDLIESRLYKAWTARPKSRPASFHRNSPSTNGSWVSDAWAVDTKAIAWKPRGSKRTATFRQASRSIGGGRGGRGGSSDGSSNRIIGEDSSTPPWTTVARRDNTTNWAMATGSSISNIRQQSERERCKIISQRGGKEKCQNRSSRFPYKPYNP